MSETKTGTPNLNKALSQLQGELPRITKDKVVKVDGREGKRGYSYSYTDLADVTQAIGPLLAKHGLAFLAAPKIDPAERRQMILAWKLKHESGEEETGEWPLGPVNQPPQSLGGAITYGRRYCLGAATGIVTEDDDDGQRAQQEHGRRQSAGDAFENATSTPPRQEHGKTSRPPRETTPHPDTQAAADEATIDEDAQVFAEEAHKATAPGAIEAIRKMAHDAGKLGGQIRNPASGGIGQLALYLNWRKKQLASAAPATAQADAFEKALGRLGDSPWADEIRGIPDGDVEQARRLLGQVDEVDMDAAKRHLVRDAILTRFPEAGATEADAA